MNWFEQKQERRRQRLEERAERLAREGRAKVESGMGRLRAIPFGQPILVGHHSEGRDRNYRRKAGAAVDKGMELQRAAGEVAARAGSVGTGGVSSDDPEAVAKLREQLEALEAKQARMVAANKLLRKGDDAGLAAMGYGAAEVAALKAPDFMGRVGYADFETKNNGANVRRVRERIEFLERQRARPSTEREAGGVRVVENVEINRLQFFFPGKPPAAVREVMKRNGFRWSPTEGAWQRHLAGHHGLADRVLEEVAKVQSPAGAALPGAPA